MKKETEILGTLTIKLDYRARPGIGQYTADWSGVYRVGIPFVVRAGRTVVPGGIIKPVVEALRAIARCLEGNLLETRQAAGVMTEKGAHVASWEHSGMNLDVPSVP